MPNDLSQPLLRDAPNTQRFLLFAGVHLAIWFATWYSARLLDIFGVVSLWYLPAGLRFFSLLVLGWRGFLLETSVQMIWGVLQFTQLWGLPQPEIFSIDTLWLVCQLVHQSRRGHSSVPLDERPTRFHPAHA